MENTPERYFIMGNGEIVMVFNYGTDMPVAIKSDGENAMSTAFPFYPEDFNAEDLGTFEEFSSNSLFADAYAAMKDTGLIIAAGPLTIVRAMYTLSKEGGAIKQLA